MYLTTGETVGAPGSRIPACGLPWRQIRPPIGLDLWPYANDGSCARFTTVSTWLTGDYVTDGETVLFDNSKRARVHPVRATAVDDVGTARAGPVPRGDGRCRRPTMLERNGWHVRHSVEVAATPEAYRAYVQRPSASSAVRSPRACCFRNAWVSDRTLCYLASGQPVVVQHTGPSGFLPDGEGMFRFSTVEQAADALRAIQASYERHRRAAREIAETFFDSKRVLAKILDAVL